MADSGMPLERTRWFVARAGARTGATAARLRAALDAKRNVPTMEELPQRLIAEAMEALRPRIPRHLDDKPFMLAVDADGAEVDVRADKGSLTERSVGPVARVERFRAPWAFLAIGLRRVDPYQAGALRLVKARESGGPALIETSAFSAPEGLLVGLITSFGEYQTTVAAATLVRSWEELGPTLDPTLARGIGRVTQLDIHPSNGNILVAAAAGGGVWRTDDAGSHWRPLMDGEESLTIGAVAIAPSDPNVIYAASGEDARPYDPAWPGPGIYRSSDGGTTWTAPSYVRSSRFSEIAVHPWNADIAYAAGNVGLYRTKNGGFYWRRLLRGRITSVVVDQDDPHRVYVGVYRRGVYRSTNGQTFSRLQLDAALPPTDHGYIKLAIGRRGAHGPAFLITKLGNNGQRIYTTTDGGDTWTRRPDNVATSIGFAEWTSVVAVNPLDEQCLYAGQRFTLKRSDDGGATWQDIGAGLHPDHQDLVFDPGDPDRIYLGNDAGVYRSADKGQTWAFASGDLNIAQLHDMDITEQDPEIVACGAQESGIHYRASNGVWRALDFPFDGTHVAIDASDAQIVYFSGQFGITNMLAGGNPALARTLDAGTIAGLGTSGLTGKSPFVTILTLDPSSSVTSPASKRVMFLGGHDGLIPHLFRSADGGAHWTRADNADGTPFVPEGNVTAIEFAPGSSSNVCLGTSLGALYRTTNGGATGADWTRMITTPISEGQISAIAADPLDPGHVWVTFSGDGVTFTDRPDGVPTRISHVYKTKDGGATWIDASGWFFWELPEVPTSAVVLDDQSAYPDRAYVGTDTGVFMTTNGGFMWCRLGQGLPTVPITRLRLRRSGRWLFAATMGRGVYRYKLD